MITWLNETLAAAGVTWGDLLRGLTLFVVLFTGSLAVVTWLLIKLPAEYFSESHPRPFMLEHHPVLRWTGLLAKNLLGAVLVVVGIVLSLPGIPGQGILTILLGIMLLDFPGKRQIERKLVGSPRVYAAINRLRARFGKPPLVLDGPLAEAQTQQPSQLG
jgi:hypothetical protein